MLANLFKGTNLIFTSLIIAAIALAIFMATPTGVQKEVEDNTVKIYLADNISTAHQQMIDAFNEQHKDKIEVIGINLPFSIFTTNERKELLTRTLRSRSNRIDILVVDLIWMPRFAKWAEPLDQYIPRDFPQNMMPHAMAPCYYDSTLVALPLYTDIGVMYYREDLVRKLPDGEKLIEKIKTSISWEELLSLVEIHNGDQPKITYGYASENFEGLICHFVELLASQSETELPLKSFKLQSPEARKALQLMVDFVQKYNITPKQMLNFDEYLSYYFCLENDIMFWRGWPGLDFHYGSDPRVAETIEKVGLGAVPHFKNGRPTGVYGGWCFMISKDSEYKQEAAEFIKFALSEQTQKATYETAGYVPINQNVYQDSVFLEKHPQLRYYQELMKNGVHRPYSEEYTKISDILSYHLQAAIRGDLTPEQALENALEAIDSDKVLIQ